MGLVSIGFAVWLLLDEGVRADDLPTVASLFVGLASLLLALLDFFRQEPTPPDPAEYADDLARTLKAQWLDEAEARRLRDPRVLPLAWATTTREVADEPRGATTGVTGAPGTPGGRVLRVRLDGRLDGRFDHVTDQLAQGYGGLPHGRLVVIGEPGAGKTVLAMLLTLGLLNARTPGSPVPVLLPVSSWDPLRERLDDWIVRCVAVPHYSGRQEIPRTLLAHGLLLPVLDGLDEIPESARRGAIRGINHAIGGERPVVVTCRAVEYEELIRGGAPRLRQAPVVEVLPVPPADVIAYLRDTEWPQEAVWDGVYDRLNAEPDGPLAEALSTPLMVTTARLVYQRDGVDPVELLDRDRFDCRYAMEDHLTHQVVDAAYSPDPRLPDGSAVRQRWRPEQARRWLTFLACYLHDHRERDLAWWLMGGRLLPTWMGPVFALVLGLVLAFGASVWVAVTDGFGGGAEAFSGVVAFTLAIGAGFALFGSVVWYMVGNPLPGRLSWSLRGSTGRLRRGFRNGVVLCVAFVVPVAAAFTLVTILDSTRGPGTLQGGEAVAQLLTVCVALSVVMGLSLAAHSWLNAPPSRATQVSPTGSLAQDRRSALTGALVAGMVFGATGLFGLRAGLMSGGLVFRWLTGWPGWPPDGEVGEFAAEHWRQTSPAFSLERYSFGLPHLLPATLFALLVLLSRAWPRLLLTRFWLAARGRLPWRLMAFLADARRREILRQAGGAYQFRHIRLQEALAARPTYEEPQPSVRRLETAAVRRRVVLTAGLATAVTGLGAVIRHHTDDSVRTFSAHGETFATAVVFQPETSEVFWGDSDGRIWRGSHLERQRVWLKPPTTRHRDEDGAYSGVDGMAFHRGGEVLAVNRGGRLELWDVGVRPRSLHSEALSDPIGSLTFSLDGKYLAAIPDSEASYGVFLGRVGANGRLAWTKPLRSSGDTAADAVGFLHGGGLAVLHEERVRMYPAPGFEKGQDLFRVDAKGLGDESGSLSMTVNPYDHCLLVSGDKKSQLWRLEQGEWAPATKKLPSVYGVAFHPTAPLLALCADGGSSEPDGTIEVWPTKAAPTRLRRYHGHMSDVFGLDFSSDGRWLATASDDGTVRLWDVHDLV